MAESSWFHRFARATSRAAGSPWTFAAAVGLIGAWAASGPLLGFSERWQLYANTFTTLVTFLMVFIIQTTQNRDTAEIKGMLRELIEDISEVDERRAVDRADEEAKR